jgi:hypothetical protein
MYRKIVSQDKIILALKLKIEFVLIRPMMYARNAHELYGLLVGYVDSLALACSGYIGGFIYGGVPVIDRLKSDSENMTAIIESVAKILSEIPEEPTNAETKS